MYKSYSYLLFLWIDLKIYISQMKTFQQYIYLIPVCQFEDWIKFLVDYIFESQPSGKLRQLLTFLQEMTVMLNSTHFVILHQEEFYRTLLVHHDYIEPWLFVYLSFCSFTSFRDVVRKDKQ